MVTQIFLTFLLNLIHIFLIISIKYNAHPILLTYPKTMLKSLCCFKEIFDFISRVSCTNILDSSTQIVNLYGGNFNGISLENSSCALIHIYWRRETALSPPVKYFFTDRPKTALLLWIIYVISVLCLLCFRASVY